MSETATANARPGSDWGSAPTTAGVGSSSVQYAQYTPHGDIVIPGFGPLIPTGHRTKATHGDQTFNGKTGYSVSDLNSLFDQMEFSHDPRLAQFMQTFGITDTKIAKKVWKDAATYAVSVARTGQNVNFFDLIGSKEFQQNHLRLPGAKSGAVSGPTTTSYLTDYFTKSGKPKPALNEMFTKALTDILGHVPTVSEKREYASVLTDMKHAQDSGLFTASQTQGKGFGISRPAADPAAWLQEQLTNKHQARVQYGKESAQQTHLDQFARLASEYGYKVFGPDGKTLTDGARKQLSLLESGKTTLDDIANQFKTAALAQYSYLKPQFDAGLTLQQIAAPAISSIASILEKDPNSIGMNDPWVQKYLQGPDGKGPMPLYKYEAMLRQDPSWQYTSNAHEKFSDLAMQIGQRFGMVG